MAGTGLSPKGVQNLVIQTSVQSSAPPTTVLWSENIFCKAYHFLHRVQYIESIQLDIESLLLLLELLLQGNKFVKKHALCYTS